MSILDHYITIQGDNMAEAAASDSTDQPPDAAQQVRQQVEQEQALADAQRRVKGLEDELAKVTEERKKLEGEKREAGQRILDETAKALTS